MKVAYVFSSSGHTASYKLGRMILFQLEDGDHGAEVVGMFFFDDNTYLLRQGDPMGERLSKVAKEKNVMLMLCDQCALERGLAKGKARSARPVDHQKDDGTVEEHAIEVGGANPDGHNDHEAEHGPDHVHGPDCGHEAVPHGDHTDYLVEGHLHHPHDGHCDNHGSVEVAS